MLLKIASISCNPASKYDVKMSKRLQLLRDLVPQTPYQGSAPGPRCGTSVSQTPCAPPHRQILATPLRIFRRPRTLSAIAKSLVYAVILAVCWHVTGNLESSCL